MTSHDQWTTAHEAHAHSTFQLNYTVLLHYWASEETHSFSSNQWAYTYWILGQCHMTLGFGSGWVLVKNCEHTNIQSKPKGVIIDCCRRPQGWSSVWTELTLVLQSHRTQIRLSWSSLYVPDFPANQIQIYPEIDRYGWMNPPCTQKWDLHVWHAVIFTSFLLTSLPYLPHSAATS